MRSPSAMGRIRARIAAILVFVPLLAGPAALPEARPPIMGREECTIGVACGEATVDGRPLLWKTRDTDSAHNEVYCNTSFPQRFVAVVNADGEPESKAWMGVNESGFAVLNANVQGLRSEPDLPGNGAFMRDALGTCASVAAFVALLDSTNSERSTHGCFGVIDSTGAAFMFEVSPDSFWTYDASEAPGGFLVRANFACKDTILEGPPSGGGIQRFRRSMTIVSELADEDRLGVRGLIERQLRDFSAWDGEPFPVPCHECGGDSMPGFINTRYSICGDGSASAALVQGVLPGEEPAYLSTFWVLLGNPALSPTLPYWPVGAAPFPADGFGSAPLCDRARVLHRLLFCVPENPDLADSYLLLDGEGGGLWTELLPLEGEILAAAEAELDQWRQAPPGWGRMLVLEDSLAQAALDYYLNMTPVMDPANASARTLTRLGRNHPNPFGAATTISYELPRAATVDLSVYDPSGRRVERIFAGRRGPGRHTATWNAAGEPSGVYFFRLRVAGETHTRKCFHLR